MTNADLRHLFAVLVIALGSWLMPRSAAAQIEVSGTVTGSSGEALAGVIVEASSPALIQRRVTTITDDHGRYTFSNLRPGSYAFAFMKDGFPTFLQTDVELSGAAQEV